GRPDRRPGDEHRSTEHREGGTKVDRALCALHASFCREGEDLLDGPRGGGRDDPERARVACPEAGPQQDEEEPEHRRARTTPEEPCARGAREAGPIERAEDEEQHPGGQAVRARTAAAARKALRVVGGQRRGPGGRLWAGLGAWR